MAIQPIDYVLETRSLVTSLFKEAPIFQGILESIMSPYTDLQTDLIWLSENMLNIDVAEKWHLDFIGEIVGQKRLLVNFNTEPYFGFEGAYQAESFGTLTDPNVGGYWNSYSYLNVAGSRSLNDEEYRRLIKARIIKNNSNCSINDILQVLNLISNDQNNIVNRPEHRKLTIQTQDQTGLVAYFVDRLEMEDSILPIAYGINVELIA